MCRGMAPRLGGSGDDGRAPSEDGTLPVVAGARVRRRVGGVLPGQTALRSWSRMPETSEADFDVAEVTR
ncbi:hypothetical protein DUHN55_34650 [Helicobacter pylori]